MGDLSPNFDRAEFACKGKLCCGQSAPIEERLIAALEHLRRMANLKYYPVDVSIEIQSGFRCQKHNSEIGSKPSSYHTLGMAADIVPHGISILKLASVIRKVPDLSFGGVGLYDTFMHVDVRKNGPTNW